MQGHAMMVGLIHMQLVLCVFVLWIQLAHRQSLALELDLGLGRGSLPSLHFEANLLSMSTLAFGASCI